MMNLALFDREKCLISTLRSVQRAGICYLSWMNVAVIVLQNLKNKIHFSSNAKHIHPWPTTLEVGFFPLLKKRYGKLIEKPMTTGDNNIDKDDFLHVYSTTRRKRVL
jgi:hypothetical protein